MKLWKYDSYEEYVEAQTKGNVKKITNIWVTEFTIKVIKSKIGDVTDILCHGTRNGTEQKYFKKFFPNCNVVGTEISYTATEFPDTIQWDFHEPKQEWIGKHDIVYSNSFDHSYDPEKSLSTWAGQLNDNGVLAIELMVGVDNNKSKAQDPLELSYEEYEELLTRNDLKIFWNGPTRSFNRLVLAKKN